MKKKNPSGKLFSTAALLLLLCSPAGAQDLTATLSGIANLFYGIAAGVAALMLAFLALKWKTAEGPQDRESAKRGMVTVVIALVVVMLAGTAVDLMNRKNPGAGDGGVIVKMSTTSEIATTRRISTTTRAAATTTTTIAVTPYLVPESLVKCVKSKGDLFSAGAGCGNCVRQMNVFYKDTVGNGQYWYGWMNPTPGPPSDRTCLCSVYPCWCYKSGNALDNCHTFSELNAFWGCGLLCKPGYVYYDCNGAGSIVC
jgi:hypothetical protein